jgi:hypothetical protein
MGRNTVFVTLLLLTLPMTGCIDPNEDAVVAPSIDFPELDDENLVLQVPRGIVSSFDIDSKTNFEVIPGPAVYLLDEFGVHRVGMLEFEKATTAVQFLALDTLHPSSHLLIRSGQIEFNITLEFVDEGLGIVDGERAYDTIDYITSNYNNRWCASASLHEGGQNYEIAAEAMAEEMREMGFDFVEVTRYEDDPDQLNVVGYNWGRTNPDEYIVVGGHFDIAYVFTPPGGGTNEGANDDTSGSTVSLEMAQALATMEFDHTVVAALWACEEEGLLGSLAYVEHLPENVSVKAYMNFDMVALNYPIIPPPGYGPYELSISIAGANEERMNRMIDWVGTTIEDDLAYEWTDANRVFWQIAESCASDHCAFFSAGYPTFNFFSPGGEISFWQEWHSPSDTLEFMTLKAGGQPQMASGFNTLVWISLALFIQVDNADDFYGNWYDEQES